MEIIAEEIEVLKAKIAEDESFKLGNLGVLYLDNDKSITFQPSEQVNFLSQNLGLQNLRVNQLKKENKAHKKHIKFTLTKAGGFKYAAAAVFIVGMLTISTQVNDIRKYNSAEMLSLPEMTFKSIEADIKQNESLELVANMTAEAQATNEPTTEAQAIPYQFHVVVASVRSQKAAEDYCKLLLNNNFSEAHILSSTKLYKVILQSFDDKDKAIDFMENLRKTDNRFETAWVMCD